MMNRFFSTHVVTHYGSMINGVRYQSLLLNFSRKSFSSSHSSCLRCSTPLFTINRWQGSVPRPKISPVTHSEEWIASSSTISKKTTLKTKENLIDSAKTTSTQPFCDPPIKPNENDEKHTFKETEQDIAILPNDLNKGASVSLKQLANYYTRLSKKNLTILVATTAAYGFVVAPLPINVPLLTFVTLGTVLTSASANTINQLMEIPYDAQMKRTRNRVMVLGQMSYRHAVGFASATLISGVLILTLGCNTLTGLLGLSNFLLYTCVYTPMKRQHIANTWLGSIVGAIPPVMGWTACTGTIDSGALLLAFLLYAWQFPHFNSLSWNIRREYEKAGYKMMCVSHERLCLVTSLRYSLMITLACSCVAPAIDMTTWYFALDSLPVNFYLMYLSYQFYRQRDAQSSRKLFRYSLIHLPLLFTLMVIHRKLKRENHSEVATTNEIIPITM